MTRRARVLKRAFDLLGSTVGLVLTAPVILFAFLAASVDTRRSGFFTQRRVGMHGTTFRIIKIRTMRSLPGVATVVTTSNDPRITRLGRFLRRTKIDELPQLFNVLIGQMSFVGPRPDVPGFADLLTDDDRIVLSVRPGITGPASLEFRNEEELLGDQEDPEAFNREILFPAKVRLNRVYIEHYSFLGDLRYIWNTVLGPKPARGGVARAAKLRNI